MHSPYFRVSFIHESTTLFASSQFASPVSFNLSQLVDAADVVNKHLTLAVLRTFWHGAEPFRRRRLGHHDQMGVLIQFGWRGHGRPFLRQRDSSARTA